MQNYFESAESIEARAILRLVDLGATTVEAARDLIGVPERQEHALRMFVASAGKDGAPIHRALNFRMLVMIEFEKLVSATMAPAAVA